MSTAQRIEIDPPRAGLATVCEPILRGLPDWFGIEEAIVEYVNAIETLPTFLARIDRSVVGFLTVKRHFERAAEIHVMGVEAALHRAGTGRALVEAAERWLADDGAEFLQVKTLSPSRPDANYERTRLFYQAMGFRRLEEFPTLWGERNPCLLMVKSLR